MVELDYYHGWYRTAPFIHKSIGVLLFLVTLARLIWRLNNVTPQALASHTTMEKKSAAAAHVMLYLLLFALMFSGYLISTADGRAIEVFNLFTVPATVQGIENQEDIAGDIHRWLAYLLIGLVVIHALGAIKHHFWDKDETLKRMLRQ
jgi:cytochrome b561